MAKKISITFVFTMVFAIVALFAATQVFANEITKPQGSHILIEYDGQTKVVSYDLRTNGTLRELRVNGEVIPPGHRMRRNLNEFRFCYEVPAGTTGAIQIPRADGTDKSCVCHEPIRVLNESGFLSNPSCPIFIYGIWIDPCQ